MSDMSGFVGIKIDVDDRDVMRLLTRLDTSLDPATMAVFLEGNISPYLAERASDRFAEEGDDASGKWEPLSGATQYIRASQGYGAAHPINVRTGQLEDFITAGGRAHPTTWGATLNYPGKRPTGKLYSKVKTAQRGQLKPLTAPRPVLAVNEHDLEVILIRLSWHVTTGVYW